MTEDEIRSMEPGPELDALVATSVFDWHLRKDGMYACAGKHWIPSTTGVGSKVLPQFSTYIDAAMRALEHERAKWSQEIGKPARFVRMVSQRDGGWSVLIGEECANTPMTIVRSEAPELPEAISKALCLLRGDG